MANYDRIIVLRSVYGKANQVVYLQPAKDPKTNIYPTHIRRVDSRGDMILSETDKELGYDEKSGLIFIKEDDLVACPDGKTFDMEDPLQKSEWEAIRYSKIIAPDRYAKESDGSLMIEGSKNSDGTNRSYGIAELYVEHVGRESDKKASRKELIHNANTFIYSDTIEGRRKMCKILGKNPERVHDSDVTNYLTEKAEKDPNVIIELYTGDDTHLRLLFIDAREKSIIRHKDRLYIYGDGIVLGSTDESVIGYLRDPRNKKLVDMIKRDVNPDLYFDDIVEDEDKAEKPVKKEQSTKK